MHSYKIPEEKFSSAYLYVRKMPMKSFFVELSTPLDDLIQSATIIISDNNLISVGMSEPDGRPRTLRWHTSTVDVFFDEVDRKSILVHRRTKYRLTAAGPGLFDAVSSLKSSLYQPWYKGEKAKNWKLPLLIFLGIILGGVAMYWVVVPFSADQLSKTISVDTEKTIGDEVYSSMNLKKDEDTAYSRLLNDFFTEMQIDTKYKIRVTYVSQNDPNAFALPGGRIVVYSRMLAEIDTYPELAALLSHEFTHIQKRHATRMIFRKLGSKAILALTLGKVGELASVLAENIDDLKSLDYSRELEKEADLEGLAILKKRKIDPKGFENLFKALKDVGPDEILPEFLGTHPDLDHRIEYIRKAAVGAKVEPNEKLEEIFNQLKNEE
jgi:Zn-dependent protease with chaperone function